MVLRGALVCNFRRPWQPVVAILSSRKTLLVSLSFMLGWLLYYGYQSTIAKSSRLRCLLRLSLGHVNTFTKNIPRGLSNV